MIIVSKAKIRFLNAGRTIPVPDTSGRYKRGRDYAAGTHHHTTICRVEILEVTADTIHIRIAQLDPPRLLAARSEHGYTTDPMKAMRDEPEAIAPAELARYAAMADERARHEHAEQRNQQQAKSLAIRLKDATRLNDSTELRRVQADMGQLAASMDNQGSMPVSSAQPARRPIGSAARGRGPSYALTPGTAIA